jgi:hypothetical protein
VKNEVLQFQERLVGVAKLGYVHIKGTRNTEAGEYFKTLHWMLGISTHWHPIMQKIKKAIFTFYNLESGIFDFPKDLALESLDLSRRYELLCLLRHLLVDHPDRYLQSSCSDDLMGRVWLDKWHRTPFWYSSVMYAESNRHDLSGGKRRDSKQANSRGRYNKRSCLKRDAVKDLNAARRV